MWSAPSYHTAYDSVAMATEFTDPPIDNKDLPIHLYLTRLHFNLLLRFSSSNRLPIYPLRLATSLATRWQQLTALAKKKLTSKALEQQGIELGEFIT